MATARLGRGAKGRPHRSAIPLFHLTCDAGEVSGGTVTPHAGPVGVYETGGTGAASYAAVFLGNGVTFSVGGQQNTNYSHYKFSGTGLANVFNVEYGRISFYLKSAYTWTERQALSENQDRYVYDVLDGNGAQFNFRTTVFESSPNRLKILWGQDAYGTEYDIPAGDEETLFGSGVVLKVAIDWDGRNHGANQAVAHLALNDVRVQTLNYTYTAPNWTSGSVFFFGAQANPPNYFSCDDAIDEFKVLVGAPTEVPVNTVLPVISGTPEIGEVLSVTAGTWTNDPSGYTYDWRRDNVAIGGATANTYTIASVSGGLSCTVTATNAAGSSSAVRAESGEPRQLFLCGDSLTSDTSYGTNVQSALDTEFGADTWLVRNVAYPGVTIDGMNSIAINEVDDYVDVGHGVVFFHEYANQVSGIFGATSGATVATLLYAFAGSRVAVGALTLYATSPYNGAQSGGHNGDEAHIASEAVRANYLTEDGTGLVDFDDSTLLASVNANDGVHWTSDVYDTTADKTVTGILAAGLTGGCGDIRIYAPVFTNLRTGDLTVHIYDTVNPLPIPPVATTVEMTAGSGWDITTHTITGSQNLRTPHGWQNVYAISPAQASTHLSGGTYILS